ncbi:MAG: GLPGLI family protein [Odoribacter sp.]|nr:GLPGLI family protein [Odoribacter sp.]
MNRVLRLVCLVLVGWTCGERLVAQEVVYRDYGAMKDSLSGRMLDFWRTKRCININTVRRDLLWNLSEDGRIRESLTFPAKRKKHLDAKGIYRMCKEHVLSFCMMEYRPQTKDYLSHPMASAVVLTADGVCVTNYHVLANVILSGALKYYWPNDFMRMVMTSEGKVYPVCRILAADPVNDFAIFQVNTGGDRLSPIPLGEPLPEGSEVYHIGNPQGNLFYLTQGIVARNVSTVDKESGHAKLEMEITADYATGSSGGAIIDECGNLAGIVGGTYSVYANPQLSRNFQMSIKKAVPVKLIKECFSTGRHDQPLREALKTGTDTVAVAVDTVMYAVRYLWTYCYDKERHLTYREDRMVLVAPEVTLDMSYQPMGERKWRRQQGQEARMKRDSSLAYHLTPSFYYYYPQEQRLKNTYRVVDEDFLLRDTLCSPSWVLTEEEKSIGGYACRKACCEYGGRRWTAWFTTDLPGMAAPRHLTGLPGVVLEASDEEREVVWTYNGKVEATEEEPLYIRFPEIFSGLPAEKFPMILRLFALSGANNFGVSGYIEASGVLNKNTAPQVQKLLPSTGIDACRVTNPIERAK